MAVAQIVVLVSWTYIYLQTHRVAYVKHIQPFAGRSDLNTEAKSKRNNPESQF